jgi:hypothetical protein
MIRVLIADDAVGAERRLVDACRKAGVA